MRGSMRGFRRSAWPSMNSDFSRIFGALGEAQV